MSQWPNVQLRRIAQMRYGDSLEASSRREGPVKVYGSNGPVGAHDVANTCGPVIIVGRKGSYGKLQWSSLPVFAIDTTYFIDGRCTRADLRWLYYALQPVGLEMLSQDVGVPGLSREQAYSQRILLPAPNEQRAIADFLDTETARIDALIAKKRRLASLVEARFKRAVEVEVERLVEVHGTIPLKWFTGVTVGIVIQPSRWYVEEGGVAALRGVNVRPGKLDLNDLVQISEEGHRANAKSRLHENDLVVRTGDAGAAVVVPPAFDGANCIDLLVIRRSPELDSQFLEFMLNSVWAKKQITRGSVGTIQSHFNVESLRELPVPCVPLEAQHNLRQRLDAESMHVGQIVSKLRRQLNLLTEHRQALITAAVTGELEVPEPRRTPSNGRQMSTSGSRGRGS